MSAKPQPMAGQSDAADDLIAELAKLMAQDAKGERPAEVGFPAFSVRIPGGDPAPAPVHAPAAPAPRFDFERTVALVAEEPVAAPVARPTPSPAPASAEDVPEPFHFDFDLGSAPKPAPEIAPVADHDSIADLIAAELSPTPAAEPTAPAAFQRSMAQSALRQQAPADAATRAEPREFNLRPRAEPGNVVEPDSFKVPPVFGLGSGAAPAEPATASETLTPAEPLASLRAQALTATPPAIPVPEDDNLGRDPIDEIESLIGRAMRVEFDRPAAPSPEARPAASPALHSLATGTASVPPEPAAATSVLSGADEAILAAARATGAEIGWVEAPEVDETETFIPAAVPRRGFRINRSLAGPLVAIVLLLAAGFGLYWVLGLGGESGPAPLLTADASPVKEVPEVPADAGASRQSVVFNEIDGVVPGAEEQLVSRDQADVNEVMQVPPAAEVSEEGLANRKVRTVTVRPDGTIVSGEESVAGSAILPVARPNVPEVPGAETASPELLASAEAPAATPAPASVSEPTATVTPVVPGSIVQAVDASGNILAGKTAPVPMLRPAGLVQATAPMVTTAVPVNAVVTPSTSTGGNMLPPPPSNSAFGTVSQQPAASAAQPAASSSIPGAVEVEALPNSAPAYAQLASLRSEAEARQAAQNLVTRFGPLFGGANMEVQRVDLGARGIYYRVRVPAASTSAASNICANVIAAGGDCVPM